MWFILKGGTGFGCAFPQPKPKKEKEPMKLITATLVAITRLSLCTAPLVLAQDDSFVGKWNFNPDKSQLNGLTYTVDQGGTGKYKFTFGDDTETLTLGQGACNQVWQHLVDHPERPNAWKWGAKARRESLFR